MSSNATKTNMSPTHVVPSFFIYIFSMNACFIYFFKKIFIFRLISLLSFILFRESFLNDGYFFVVRLIFKEVFLIHLYKKNLYR